MFSYSILIVRASLKHLSYLVYILPLQFVVVSLKDGMFTNANVLFKTKFVDGMSTVTRTALSQSDANLPQKGQDKARQKDKRNQKLIS